MFVGEGGFVTCSGMACPNPSAPSEALGVKFPATMTEFVGSPHVCDKSCRHDRTVYNTVFGRGLIISDCRVPPNAWVAPGVIGGPHTCTEAEPCDTRP